MAKRFGWAVAVFLVWAGCASSTTDTPDKGGGADIGPITVDYGGLDSVEPYDFGPDARTCGSDMDCDGEQPLCDTTYGVCVECRGPADCIGKGFCLQGTCAVLTCQPGSKVCIGNVAKVCSADGQKLNEDDCGWDLVCYEGECLTCRPGSVDCPQVNKARFCLFDGSGWNETDCGEQRCFNGQCGTCVPGQRECQGSSVMACAMDGGGYAFQEDCDTENTGRMCHLGMCINLCEFNSKFKTNNGCEYWAVDLDQFYDSEDTKYQGKNAPFAVVVSNTNQSFNATITVYNASGVVKTVTAPPKQATIIDLPSMNIEGSGVTDKAYRVTSTLPIVAYQFNPLENVQVFSNDASLLIPTNALGKQYIILSWPTIGQNSDGQLLASTFTIVATESGETVVDVTPSATVAFGPQVPGLAAGASHTWTLTQGQVLNIEAVATGGDLTGSIVTADKRIVVFGGHVCATVPVNISACDHLEQQLPPISAWGKRYLVPKTFKRGLSGDIVRVLASEDGTSIAVKGTTVSIPVLNRGKFYEFEILKDTELSSNKPFLVGQYLEGQDAPGGILSSNNANIGDPTFMVGVSLEQFRTEYVFLVPPKYKQSYISILAKTGASVTLDGGLLTPSIFRPMPSGDYIVATVPMRSGSHTLSSTDRAGLLVYGWDQYVSYGYPGGMNVETLQVYQ